MLKILHTADWHYNERDHDEIEKCVDYLIDVAFSVRPDLILISGDITDSMHLKLDSRSARTIVRQVSNLSDIAPVLTILGTPTHDGKSAEILRYIRGEYPIHVSDKSEQLYLSNSGSIFTEKEVVGDIFKAVITQIPTPTKKYLANTQGILESDLNVVQTMSSILAYFGVAAEDFDCPHIVNGHFQVGGAKVSETQVLTGRDIELSRDQLAMTNADIVCLGHIHKAQAIANSNICYCGSIYSKTFGELDDKGFYIHVINGGVTTSRFVQVPAKKRVVFRFDLAKDVTPTTEKIINSISIDTSKGSWLAKIEIKIFRDEANLINQAGIEAACLEMGFESVVIDMTRIPRETVRASRVLEVESLRDKIQAMAEVRQEEISPSILDKADLLEEAVETGKVDEFIKI